jgi:hypothetical protein
MLLNFNVVKLKEGIKRPVDGLYALAIFAKNFAFALRLDLFLPQRAPRKIRKENKVSILAKSNGNSTPESQNKN